MLNKVDLQKAVRDLQDIPHKPFGTQNVESSSKSNIRRILRELSESKIEMELTELERIIDELAE